MNNSFIKIISIIALTFISLSGIAQNKPIPEVNWDELNKTKPWLATELYKEVSHVKTNSTSKIPSDAMSLFNGKDQSKWQKPQSPIVTGMKQFDPLIRTLKPNYNGEPSEWIVENGQLIVNPGKGHIASKRAFGDIQLHLEWLSPKAKGKEGQKYSNSGVFFMGIYEVQILNSFQNKTYANGQAGAIYKQHIPLVNASLPPDNWQTYDIIFMAPKFSDKGTLVSPAKLTVLHNGILIQNNVELLGPTCYIGTPYYVAHPSKLPLVLQDHGDPVRFRNIWVREL